MLNNHSSEHMRSERLRSVRFLFAVIIAVFLLAAACMILFFIRRDTPGKAVRSTLNQISSMEDPAISQIVLPESGSGISEKAIAGLHRFFDRFSYKILSVTQDGDSAVAQVTVTTPDAYSLASDIRLSLLQDSDSGTDASEEQIYSLLEHLLSENEYPSAETTGTIELIRQKEGWTVVQSDDLSSLLLGSLPQALADPWLLSPQQVLTVYLDRVDSMSADEWAQFFSVHDLFATYSTNAAKIDSEFLTRAADSYSYSAGEADIAGNQATVSVVITAVDTSAILKRYREKLSQYADTLDAIRADTTAVSEKSAQLLLESICENESTTDLPVTVPMENNGNGWIITDTSSLTDALFGGMSEAAGQFSSSPDE